MTVAGRIGRDIAIRDNDIADIVEAHNTARRNVRPSASNMQALVSSTMQTFSYTDVYNWCISLIYLHRVY